MLECYPARCLTYTLPTMLPCARARYTSQAHLCGQPAALHPTPGTSSHMIGHAHQTVRKESHTRAPSCRQGSAGRPRRRPARTARALRSPSAPAAACCCCWPRGRRSPQRRRRGAVRPHPWRPLQHPARPAQPRHWVLDCIMNILSTPSVLRLAAANDCVGLSPLCASWAPPWTRGVRRRPCAGDQSPRCDALAPVPSRAQPSEPLRSRVGSTAPHRPCLQLVQLAVGGDR